ncbi:MAG: DUF305 domain-containing protein [Dehalococcoidia bacterium]
MEQGNRQHEERDRSRMQRTMYLRFGGMIVTGMVIMYAVMFVGSWEWSHIRFSESRVFMALTMGGAMTLVMLGWMLNMYGDMRLNVAIIALGLLLLIGGAFLDRSQTTVQDTGFMSSMIPHHSLAITRSERSELSDLRVCELAVSISEAQRREILEMDWLIDDIERNGPARTREEVDARPVPEFDVAADRQCEPG